MVRRTGDSKGNSDNGTNAGTLGAVLEAPALVAGLDDVAVVGEAIEQRPRSCLLPGEIQGAGLRANQDNDGMAFR